MSELEDTIAALQGLNIDTLRQAWRERIGGPAPAIRSGELLRRLLAERLQLAAFGTDADLDRRLRALASVYERRKATPAAHPTLRLGAVLVRQHDGETHRVEVIADGFRWRDKSYRSLSEIARAITGTRWNGPRFFGLREPRP